MAQVGETSLTVNNIPIQGYDHVDDQAPSTYKIFMFIRKRSVDSSWCQIDSTTRLHLGLECFLQLKFSHCLQMNLIRAISNAQTPSSCIEISQRCILGYSLPTMHLNRSVNNVTGHARNCDLCHSNLQELNSEVLNRCKTVLCHYFSTNSRLEFGRFTR